MHGLFHQRLLHVSIKLCLHVSVCGAEVDARPARHLLSLFQHMSACLLKTIGMRPVAFEPCCKPARQFPASGL